MNNLTKYLGISALVLSSSGCVKQLKTELPVAEQQVNPCREDKERFYSSICEFDDDEDGVIDEIIYWKDGKINKKVEGKKTIEFFRSEEGSLVRAVEKESNSTRVREYGYGALRKVSYDIDSDGNPEEIFKYRNNGGEVYLYLEDVNSDGQSDSIHLFDANGKVIHRALDIDINGKFDTYIDYTRDQEGKITLERKSLDKDENGYITIHVDVMYFKHFDNEGNLIRTEADYNADGIIDDVWYP